jgi:predicted MFS family arabinose efflux permease
LIGGGMVMYSINQISVRQALTPDHLLGRVNASRRVLVFGVAPIGALLAGVLGETIGLRPTLWIGAAVELLAVAIAFWSPLRDLREQPRAAA